MPSHVPWHGGFGVYFRGGRASPVETKAGLWADALFFDPFTMEDDPTKARLLRGVIRQRPARAAPFNDLMMIDWIPRPQLNQEKRLVLSVSRNSLQSILWDDKPVARSLWVADPLIPSREGANGTVGIIVDGATIRIREVRFHPRPPMRDPQ